MDLTSNFFVICINMKVYTIKHSGWSLARTFMKERVKREALYSHRISVSKRDFGIMAVSSNKGFCCCDKNRDKNSSDQGSGAVWSELIRFSSK